LSSSQLTIIISDGDGGGVLPPLGSGTGSGGGVVIRSGGFVSISRGAVMVMGHQ